MRKPKILKEALESMDKKTEPLEQMSKEQAIKEYNATEEKNEVTPIMGEQANSFEQLRERIHENMATCPYVIRVRNVSETKLTNVPVFDFDHKSNMDVRYENYADSTKGSYDRILREISSYSPDQEGVKIGMIYLSSKEAFSMQHINLVYYEANGRKITIPLWLSVDAYQQQSHVLVAHHCFHMNVATNLILRELAPGQELKISLYPISK